MWQRPWNTTHPDRFTARPGWYRKPIEDTKPRAPGRQADPSGSLAPWQANPLLTVDFFFPPHKDLGHLHGDRVQGTADRGTGITGPIQRGSGTADKGIGISGDFYNFDNWINFKKTLKLITEKIIKLKKGTDEITTLPNTKYSKARGIVPKCGIFSPLQGFFSGDNDKARKTGPCHISDRCVPYKRTPEN